MANIYDWLKNVDPALTAPSAPTLRPADENPFIGEPMDQIMPLDIDESGNMYFDMPRASDTLFRVTDPSAPTTSGQTVVTVPEHLAEASSQVLIYLTQILKISESSEKPNDEEATLAEEELDALGPIDEDEFEFSTPSTIDGIQVNRNPKSMEIEDVIDHRRVGPDRQTFYLARSINGTYYWFHTPYTARDRQLRRLIGDYRRESQAKASRKTYPARKLRSGKTIRI